MAGIEEKYECSGICTRAREDKRLPIYLFSNINNGMPETSCKDHAEE